MCSMLTALSAPMTAQAGLVAVWDAVWPYLLMLAGFSVIVFVHELGHFAVAKWAGVRVDRFAVGFGREIAGFTWGETRYSFNVLPIGGYVKMLGQEDFEDKANELRFKDDPRSFVNKPVGHRMAIVSAGVIMNVIFACLVFMVVFLIGMEAIGPRIAQVEPDSPAERAGLQPGDVVHSINGERVYEFNEIKMAVLLASPHEPVEFVVKRDGTLMGPVLIKPEYRRPETTRDTQRHIVGIAPGLTNEIFAVGPGIDTSEPHFPHVGDRLVEVAGIEVTDENASEVFNMLAYTHEDIYVERPDSDDPDGAPQRVRVEIPPILSLYPSDADDPESINVLGLTPLAKFLSVDPEGRAYYAGLRKGDVVLSWDDVPYPNHAFIARSVRDNAEQDIAFTVRRADGGIYGGFVRPERHERGPATIQAVCNAVEDAAAAADGPVAHFELVRPGGPTAKAGIETGDLIVSVDGRQHPACDDVNRVVRTNHDVPVSVGVRKPDGRVVYTAVVPQAPGSIDANFLLIADEVLVTSKIVDEIDGRPTPAAQSGIPAGARILSIDGEAVSTWRDLIAAFRRTAGTTVEMEYARPDRSRTSASFPVPHSIRTVLGVGPEARILAIDGRETVTIPGDPPQTVSVRYHEGTKAILKELAGRDDVPVEYRENLLSDRKTAYLDVTEDMVDPWLGRVTFTPNVYLKEQTVLLKGENALEAIWIGIHKTYYFIRQVCLVMERMFFSRTVGFENAAGPLGIFDIGGRVARAGMVNFLFFLAIISANLAVLNMLPLPILDGGLMVFLIIEKIKGSPISLRVQVATQIIGLALIIGVFAFVTYQDVVRMWG